METTTDLVPAGPAGTLPVRRRWPRAALWEDALGGVRLAGAVGAGLLLAIALELHLAGAASVLPTLRQALFAAGIGGLAWWLRGRVQSLTVIDDAAREIHDAVRIGETVYIQASVPFDRVVAVRQSRREAKPAAPGEDSVEEARLELVLRGGERRVLTDWVSDAESTGGREWRRMEDRLTALLDLTDAPLDVREASSAGGEDWSRFGVWLAAAVATAGVLSILG